MNGLEEKASQECHQYSSPSGRGINQEANRCTPLLLKGFATELKRNGMDYLKQLCLQRQLYKFIM